jgi:hypothetical protein
MSDTASETPRADDDRQTAERKSKTIDERVPERQGPDLVPQIETPGAAAANIPQAGLGRDGPLEGGDLGPGEIALDRERRATRAPIQRG